MKTVVKLLIVAALINASARGGHAAWTYYQLKDSAQQLIVFGTDASTTELHNQILQKAGSLQVPVRPEAIVVNRQGSRTSAQVSYTQPVEYFPRNSYPMQFSFDVEAYNVLAAAQPRSR